ncbi:MAG: amidohydrolase [Dehalococcoidia bacterium]|nr:amidohydrolase [Dehalococcoidia bacterium]MBL7165353.1 amidohydrolase [Dehalococcoidales bacterium]
MTKVIDLELNLPPTVEQTVDRLMEYVLHRDEKGLANYGNIFGAARARALEFTPEELELMRRELSSQELESRLRERAEKAVVPLPQFIGQLDEAGIEWGVIDTDSHEKTAEIVSQYPDRFIGVAVVDPREGMKAVRELERAVKELYLKCFYATPFRFGIRANDKKFYPLYAKAVELDIPVFVYTTMTYRTDFPMDIGHPVYLDEVAMDFPELRIIAGLGGWPWVPEMVGVARRHRNVYISTAGHRPKYFATPGSGWEMLMQFGNTLLQDQVVFASSWWTYDMPIGQVVDEMKALPLKDSVKDKWLYENARRLFRVE